MKKKPTGKHSLFTEVGITYIQGRTFERRIELAKETVALQRQPLEIKGSRYRSGKLTQLGISESQATLTNTQAYMPDLESSLPPLT